MKHRKMMVSIMVSLNHSKPKVFINCSTEKKVLMEKSPLHINPIWNHEFCLTKPIIVSEWNEMDILITKWLNFCVRWLNGSCTDVKRLFMVANHFGGVHRWMNAQTGRNYGVYGFIASKLPFGYSTWVNVIGFQSKLL